jgi:hypothetical protein
MNKKQKVALRRHRLTKKKLKEKRKTERTAAR